MKKSDKSKTSDLEAAELWRQVTKKVKPLSEKSRQPDLPALTKPSPVTKRPRPRLSPSPLVQSKSPVPAGFDRQTTRKIKRRRMAIESRIDLHGMTQEQAYKALDRFITVAVAANQRLVLVITGKGSACGTTGVLRRNVPHWLSEISDYDRITGYSEANIKDGGAGAIYVRLSGS